MKRAPLGEVLILDAWRWAVSWSRLRSNIVLRRELPNDADCVVALFSIANYGDMISIAENFHFLQRSSPGAHCSHHHSRRPASPGAAIGASRSSSRPGTTRFIAISSPSAAGQWRRLLRRSPHAQSRPSHSRSDDARRSTASSARPKAIAG